MRSKSRRKEITEGAEAMLLQEGWVKDWPEGQDIPPKAKCWINPRTKRSYTQQAAIDIEELRDSL